MIHVFACFCRISCLTNEERSNKGTMMTTSRTHPCRWVDRVQHCPTTPGKKTDKMNIWCKLSDPMSSMHLKRHVVDVLLYALYGAFVGWSFMSQAIYEPIHSCHVKRPHGIIVFGPPSGLPVTAANAAFWHGAVPSWQVLSTPIETRSVRFSCNAFKTSTQRGRAW